MADSGLNFTIARAQGLMTIGATTVPVDCSALSSEIRNIVWKGNSGLITYNADTGNTQDYVPALIADPSPYQALIDAWCTAQVAATPAIGLAQVAQIKTALVEVLYGIKRTAPIAYTVAAGALSWEATDEAAAAIGQQLTVGIIALLQTLASSSITGLVGAIDTALSTLSGNTQTVLTTFANAVDSGITAPLNAEITFSNAVLTQIEASGATWPSFASGASGAAAPTMAAAPTVTGSFSPTISPIAWIPSGATATVNVTNLELAGILGAILARRQTLQAGRLAREAAIAALGTVAAAIAYDVTTGW